MIYSIGGVHEFFTEPLSDDLMARLNPQWSVIVGGADKADNINKSRALVLERRRKFPNTAFGVRWWHARDDKMAANFVRDYGSVEAAADKYAEIFFPLAIAGTWLMAGNEEAASESDPTVFKQTVDVHTAIIRRANAAGIAIGTCCTAMGEPQYGQYELLAPLFKAMQDGRNQANPVYHIWRPNTYFPHSIGKTPAEMASLHFHLTHRHQREGRRVAALNGLQFPPTAFGEFNTVVSLQQNLDGPNSIPGYTADMWMDDILLSEIDLACAFYCVNDGLYDAKWVSFTLKPDFLEAMITRLPRLPKTLIETWKEKNMSNPTIPPPTTDGTPIRITALPQGVTHRNIRTSPFASAADVGDLRVGDVVTAYLNAQTTDAWCYLRRVSDGLEGWTLFAGVVYETVPPPTTDISFSADQFLRLQRISSDLDTLIKEVAPPSAPGGTF